MKTLSQSLKNMPNYAGFPGETLDMSQDPRTGSGTSSGRTITTLKLPENSSANMPDKTKIQLNQPYHASPITSSGGDSGEGNKIRTMAAILSQCALLTKTFGLKASEIEGMAIIWVHELRGYTPSQIQKAFETYRRDVSGVFPSSHDILKILKDREEKRLALPDPDEERYQLAIKNYSMTYSDAIFVEKRSEEKGLYLTRQAKDAIERAKQAHADSLLSPQEKKAKKERITRMFKIMRNAGE